MSIICQGNLGGYLQIGVLGQGRLGQALASNFYQQGLAVHSWSRNPKNQDWSNKAFYSLENFDLGRLDKLIIASGSSSPRSISEVEEHRRTIGYLSQNTNNFSGQIYYLSSGAVYGDCLNAITESDECKPSTVYGSAKLSTELLLRETFGSNLSVFRIGNIVPDQLDFGIFKMIKNNLSHHLPINLFGDPLDSRDYIGERDLIRVLSAAILTEQKFKVMNVGSGESISLREIAQILSDIYKQDLNIVWGPRSSSDVARTILDISYMQTLLSVSLGSSRELMRNLLEFRYE